MVSKLNNIFVVNAPAGSGKTTTIKKMIKDDLARNSSDNILAITYTNRAADELLTAITSSRVSISTIHSFLNSFMKPYFAQQAIIELYFEQYGEKIKERIANESNDEKISDSNQKYIEKYGALDYSIIVENIKHIKYNEAPFNSLYYGGLSHDDLILFSRIVFDRYPSLKTRIHSRYQVIYIDEYQDTFTDVLDIFYDSIKGTTSKLYLFGDRMQQIYSNYDGQFEDKLKTCSTEMKLDINYRSAPVIVDILNRIYNDRTYDQKYSDSTLAMHVDMAPCVLLVDDVDKKIGDLRKRDPESLILYLLNDDKFASIGASNLFRLFTKTDKYSFGKTISASDMLTKEFRDNPDSLMKLLYAINDMYEDYRNKKLGSIVHKMRFLKRIFDLNNISINKHIDKINLIEKLDYVFDSFAKPSETIGNFLKLLKDHSFLSQEYFDGIMSDKDYDPILNVPLPEVRAVAKYMSNPKVSTQHGVKGESHASVIFVADDGTNPNVKIYSFFDLWSRKSFSFTSLEGFYYSYKHKIDEIITSLGVSIADLNKTTYPNYESELKVRAGNLLEEFSSNVLFTEICSDAYKQFLEKPGVTKVKACFKISPVLGILTAYKLFYVGCSRARKNLTVILDANKVKKSLGTTEKILKKFKDIGFSVESNE